ncbi:MAG: beta-ketoacyl-[acyl-carrier-protein] synthase family protein [Deltaproteobacteria bacterium]|nr:beta-ketoacyl-[acyl-carrier-protein] synthase family protein [Deltaproteobacteria bacterium]
MKRRVVITGIGIITSIGDNIQEFWANCLQGKTRIERIPEHWYNYADFNSQLWSPLPELSFEQYEINRIERKQLDRSSLIAIGCAFQALGSAKLPLEKLDQRRNTFTVPSINKERAGAFMGTGIGGIKTLSECFAYQTITRQKQALADLLPKMKDTAPRSYPQLEHIMERLATPKRFNPFAVSMIMPNACSGNLGIKFDFRGSNNTFCAACASGTVAIGYGFKAIRSGELDLALAGGTEYLYDDYGGTFYGFDVVRALTNNNQDPDKANCPFDVKHSGFLFSEGGGAVLVIEELEHALERDAPIIAEIIGYGETCDAHNIMMMQSSGQNILRMIGHVLEDGGKSPKDVDYVNTHGTGTVLNDETEVKVIDETFGRGALVNSTKSLLGHTLGASGAIEAVVAALSIRHKTTHACKNLEEPIADLNFATQVASYPIRTALSQSFGFGGHNAALLLREYCG